VTAASDDAGRSAASPGTPRPGDVQAVPITGLSHDGDGVGRLADGRAVFVAGALAGELVEAVITEVRPRMARARLAAVPSAPAPERILKPRCPHYGPWPERGEAPDAWCGGCQLQHLDYGAQLRFKTGVVRSALQRIGGLADPPVLETVGMDDPWRYRNALRLHAAGGQLGLIARDGRTLVPITECPIAHPEVEALALAMAGAGLPDGVAVVARAGTRTGEALVALYDADDAIDALTVELDASVVLVGAEGDVHVVAGRGALDEVFAGLPYLVPATAFAQANTAMTDRLVEAVLAAVPEGAGRVVDGYCGVGLFTVALAPRAGEVVGIDVDEAAIAAAVENAAGLDNVLLIEGPVDEGLEAVEGPIDAVVLDPPRAGLEPSVVRLLAGRAPDTIVYVSCEPSSLARDVRQLVEAGFRVERAQPLDLFPQTRHVEIVCVLARAAGR